MFLPTLPPICPQRRFHLIAIALTCGIIVIHLCSYSNLRGADLKDAGGGFACALEMANASLTAVGPSATKSTNQSTNQPASLTEATFPNPQPLPLSLHCNAGRLGNQICTYATLYGLSRLNHRDFVLQDCNKRRLSHVFKGPSQAGVDRTNHSIDRQTYRISPYFKPRDAAIPKTVSLITGYFHPCSFTFFDHVRSDLRRELTFHDHLLSHAQAVLRAANVHGLPNATYVGVHVRRGDYQKMILDAFKGVPVNTEYFRRAVEYFRNKYRNLVFVAVSDDRLWCIEHMSTEFGMYIPQEVPGPEYDLAVLAACNHTIMTYGTFGFWGGYLAGGEVIYFDRFLKPNTTFTTKRFLFEKRYPPDWKGIVTVNATEWFSGTYESLPGVTSNPIGRNSSVPFLG